MEMLQIRVGDAKASANNMEMIDYLCSSISPPQFRLPPQARGLAATSPVAIHQECTLCVIDDGIAEGPCLKYLP